MSERRHIIIGAGLAGLSAAYHLKKPYEVHEKNPDVGGLARSIYVDGFKFDYAPHILFTKDQYTADLIHDLLKDELVTLSREAYIYHKKYKIYTRFPFQANLYGLPKNVVDQCVEDLKEALDQKDKVPAPTNYEEWMYWRFGKGIAEHLMIPYAERIWTMTPDKMNFDWIDERVPEPDLDIIERGAYTDYAERLGIHGEFWYPKSGGIEALPQALGERVDNIHLNSKVSKIAVADKKVQFNHKEWKSYDKLISSLALPLIVNLLDDVPTEVSLAADALECNSIVCVCLGVNRPKISPYHWLYFYEKDFIFHRLSFPMNFSEQGAPAGMSSVCCEIAYSHHRPLSVKGRDNIVQRTIKDLIKAEILSSDDEIITTEMLSMRYAYVIYDLNHRKNVNTIRQYLESRDIYTCGRFGEWEYLNMDHSMISGQKTAEKLNQLP